MLFTDLNIFILFKYFFIDPEFSTFIISFQNMKIKNKYVNCVLFIIIIIIYHP